MGKQKPVSSKPGNSSARAHGNADVGALQRRRIVDAVPCHGSHVALRMKTHAKAGKLSKRHLKGCRSMVLWLALRTQVSSITLSTACACPPTE